MGQASDLVTALSGFGYKLGWPARDADAIRSQLEDGSLAKLVDCSGLVYLVAAAATPKGHKLPAFGKVSIMAETLRRIKTTPPGKWSVFINDQRANGNDWHHCGLFWPGDDDLPTGYLHASSGRMRVVFDTKMVGVVEFVALNEVIRGNG